MSDIYNALQSTTLYYQKTSSNADPLKCYTVKDLTWDYVFDSETEEGPASKYSAAFAEGYQADKSGNPNGIDTALINENFGSKWNIQKVGYNESPKLANEVNYVNMPGVIGDGGFYASYGGWRGGLLSHFSRSPWGCCAASGNNAFYFYADSGYWDNDAGRGNTDFGVVLARDFN